MKMLILTPKLEGLYKTRFIKIVLEELVKILSHSNTQLKMKVNYQKLNLKVLLELLLQLQFLPQH